MAIPYDIFIYLILKNTTQKKRIKRLLTICERAHCI
jgi:hypothetical protein